MWCARLLSLSACQPSIRATCTLITQRQHVAVAIALLPHHPGFLCLITPITPVHFDIAKVGFYNYTSACIADMKSLGHIHANRRGQHLAAGAQCASAGGAHERSLALSVALVQVHTRLPEQQVHHVLVAIGAGSNQGYAILAPGA